MKDIPPVDLDVNDVSDVNWELRDRDEHLKLVKDVQLNHKRGVMDFQEQRLIDNGTTFYLSPLWRLENLNLFTQSPYCLLHNEFLGLIPYHTDCTLATLTNDEIAIVNERIVAFPPLPNLPSLNADVEERKGWEGKAYTAFYRMALFTFRGLLSAEAMLCWRAHCRYIRYLLKPSITTTKLQNLMATYWQWKNLFVKLYGANTNEQQHTASKKNMAFINLHIGEHWAYYIQQFGMPAEYSTQHWELLHQQIKRKEKKSNHQAPAQDIAKQIIEQKMLYYKFGRIEDLTSKERKVTRLVINETVLLNPTKQYVPTALDIIAINKLTDLGYGPYYKQYKAIIYKGQKFSGGDHFSFKQDEQKSFGKIQTIIQSGDYIAFLALLYEYTNPIIDKNQTEFYSLNATTNCTIIDVKLTRKEQFLYCEDLNSYLVNFYFQ